MKNASRSIHLSIVIASTVVTLVAGCAHVPTANQTVAVPAPARNLDLLEVAIDAAKAVGLPSVTKLDKANGVVEVVRDGKNGYLLPARTPVAKFAAHIAKLHQNPKRRRQFRQAAKATS